MASTIIYPSSRVTGTFALPGDKSISHRALMMAALAHGRSRISNLAPGRDVASTMGCLRALGVRIDDGLDENGTPFAVVYGRGIEGFSASRRPLDCGNSGTTARLLAGVLTAVPGRHVLIGDASLSRRPMARVVSPLRQLGARIRASGDNGTLPLEIHGGKGIAGVVTAMHSREWVHVGKGEGEHVLAEIVSGSMVRAAISRSGLVGGRVVTPVPSAQLKSALMLAALNASGPVVVQEAIRTRDHTERMMNAMGIRVDAHESRAGIGKAGVSSVTVRPGIPRAVDFAIPGDASIAAYMIALGVHSSSNGVVLRGVGLNPGRIGFVEALQSMGANIRVEYTGIEQGEPIGNIHARPSTLVGVTVSPEVVPGIIDELPLLAVLATQCHGETVVTGASELRIKESDRIMAICKGVTAMGGSIAALPDGFVVKGQSKLIGGGRGAPLCLESHDDHRIAMALAVGASWAISDRRSGYIGESVEDDGNEPDVASFGGIEIRDAECVAISDPEFWSRMSGAGVRVVVG